MTAQIERVRAFVARLSPHPICDRCIAERLQMRNVTSANQASRELAGADGFERRRDICSMCYAEKLVIRRRI